MRRVTTIFGESAMGGQDTRPYPKRSTSASTSAVSTS
jgi:hypothetical protein